MGILDKFMDFMNLDGDDEFEDDDFFEEELPEEKPKKSLFKRDKKYDFDDEDEDEDYEKKPSRASSNQKVSQMRQASRRSSMEVCVIKPTAVDEARTITETLLNGSTVILNLEGMDLEIAQRIIDFTSGATFAINGNLQKISNFIFLVTPTNVDISGDLQDLLNSSFDVPSIKTRY